MQDQEHLAWGRMTSEWRLILRVSAPFRDLLLTSFYRFVRPRTSWTAGCPVQRTADPTVRQEVLVLVLENVVLCGT